MSHRLASLLVPLLITSVPVSAADDLRSLVAEYRAACERVRGRPGDRAAKAREHVAPVLRRIAAVDTDAALAFLLRELRKAPLPEIAAVCAEPVLRCSHERAALLVLKGLAGRPPGVQEAVLEALADAERDITVAADELVSLAGARIAPEARVGLVRSLGRLGTEQASRALVRAVRTAGGRGGKDATDELVEAAVEALSGAGGAEVESWLREDALRAAGRDPARIATVLRAAAARDVRLPRDALVELLGHGDGQVAAAAVGALAKTGIGDAARAVARAIERRRGPGSLELRVRALDALAASGEAEAVDLVVDLARSGDPELRAVALGSLGAAGGDEGAVAALTDALEDRDPDVRSVALRTLGRVRSARAIGPLIDRLENEDVYAFKVRALEHLVRLTGQNMGLAVEDWRKWWDFAKEDFELPSESEEGITSVETYGLDYFGIEISSKRLTFIVDISSSMTRRVPVRRRLDEPGDDDGRGGRTRPAGPGGEDGEDSEPAGEAPKIDILKAELQRVLRELTPDTQINIITFDANFSPWQKRLQPLSGRGRKKALEFARSITTGHGTNVFDSLEHALQDERVDTVYLMTDGKPSRGRITDPDRIVEEIGRLNRTRAVTIHCVAFGEESDLLKRLAAGNGGKYRFVDEY